MPAFISWTKETFFANTIRDPDNSDNCWIWKGGKSGYGRCPRGHTTLGGKQMQVTKAGYILEHGMPPPKRKQINHKCNVSLCIRPDHWYVGMHRQNQEDRHNMAIEHIKCFHKSGNTKDYRTWRNENVRDLFASGHYSKSELGRMFSLTYQAVYKALKLNSHA